MRTILYLAPALFAAACASHEARNEAPATQAGTAAPSPSASTSMTRPAGQSAIAGNPLHEPGNLLASRSVYFDFDSNAVKSEYEALIKAHARYIASHSGARARIEGNCDERGSREYNLALGQRRAEAVKHVMTALGAPGAHLETVSYGEEKPAAAGHDEGSWSKNRRDDIRYLVE